MEKKVKTRRGIWKLVGFRDIWKKLTEPENDDEIEELNNQDTNKFLEDLRNIQIKTGTIKKDENSTKNTKYKINKQNIRNERDSYTQGRERVVQEQANKKILDEVKKITHKDMMTILKEIDQEFLYQPPGDA